ncbi:hypothetical protein AWB81_01321 [Caballeronia arationis]|jgi:hypothetical protein|uniref:Uncharacterized protein n=1 Tax=Caballeronia arationis TaxID=1777142 RepID=A0A7Z7I512_9BURK|nr:hypothetical protein [Caballeronia arationis]SAK54829.1 hypothetical protein AWB81_01321 [Caballeronia arationis]SOE61737.1 hypothetical protein SAMN05446927_2168 [Caballeronia arationis]
MLSTRVETTRLSELACKQRDVRAAVALLEQSIALKHRKIALIRYLHAQYLGAPLEERHHEYVHRVAARLSHEALARVARAARARVR